MTADPSAGLLVGVSATAQAGGRYAVDLSLVADMVPLVELAEQVRERVHSRARSEQLEEVLGSVNVVFAFVVTAEELAVSDAEKEVEETRAAEKLAAAAASAEQAISSTVRESASVEREVAESAAAQGGAPGGEVAAAAGFAEPASTGRDAAALAVRQAALATDQAALAAKQAALAAEQAALAAAPGMAVPRCSHERGSEEQEQ